MNTLLPKTWKVPETFYGRLGEQAGHQRTMAAEGHLLVILHRVPEQGNPERVPVIYWRDAAGSWRSTRGGAGLADLRAHQDEFSALIDNLEARMEQAPSAEDYFDILLHTAPMLRTVRNMPVALQQAREAVPEDRGLIVARDRAGELERAVELLHADAKNGMEYMVAKQAEEQAKNSQQLLVAGHRLNLLVAIFLPLTALGSAFGMNMRHGLEGITTPLLFWGTLVAGLLLGFFVKALLTLPASSPSVKARPTGQGSKMRLESGTRIALAPAD